MMSPFGKGKGSWQFWSWYARRGRKERTKKKATALITGKTTGGWVTFRSGAHGLTLCFGMYDLQNKVITKALHSDLTRVPSMPAVARGNINSRGFSEACLSAWVWKPKLPIIHKQVARERRAKIRPSLPGSAVDSMLGRLCRGLRGSGSRIKDVWDVYIPYNSGLGCAHLFSKTHKLQSHSARWEMQQKDAANVSEEVLWGPEIPAAKHILTKLTGRWGNTYETDLLTDAQIPRANWIKRGGLGRAKKIGSIFRGWTITKGNAANAGKEWFWWWN